VIAALVALSAYAVAQAQAAPTPQELFARADLNHDGVLTRAEFQASRVSRFHALDRNGDGYLSLADLPGPARLLSPGAPRLRGLLNAFDTDRDGRVSLDEFIAGSMRLFDAADTNRTGAVTLDQFRRAAAALQTGRALAEGD
jgi:Ca2+-binding EF-hand superfamily protein